MGAVQENKQLKNDSREDQFPRPDVLTVGGQGRPLISFPQAEKENSTLHFSLYPSLLNSCKQQFYRFVRPGSGRSNWSLLPGSTAEARALRLSPSLAPSLGHGLPVDG